MRNKAIGLLVAVGLILFAAYANAADKDVVLTTKNGTKVVLSEKPCSNETVQVIIAMNGEDPKDWKGGKASKDKDSMDICYRPLAAGSVLIVDERGGSGHLALPNTI